VQFPAQQFSRLPPQKRKSLPCKEVVATAFFPCHKLDIEREKETPQTRIATALAVLPKGEWATVAAMLEAWPAAPSHVQAAILALLRVEGME